MSRERKRHGRLIAAGIIIAALLGGLGFGLGAGFLGTSPANGTYNNNNPQTLPPAITPTPEPTQDLRYNITVSEDGIEFQGQSITLEALREQLLGSYSGSETYELCDNHALKSVYDSVRSMLDDIGVPYMEK